MVISFLVASRCTVTVTSTPSTPTTPTPPHAEHFQHRSKHRSRLRRQPTQKFRAGLRAAEAAQSGETGKTIVAMPNAVNVVQRRGARQTLVVKVESAVVSTSSVENYGAAMMLATMGCPSWSEDLQWRVEALHLTPSSAGVQHGPVPLLREGGLHIFCEYIGMFKFPLFSSDPRS